jgi:hypothetical protein
MVVNPSPRCCLPLHRGARNALADAPDEPPIPWSYPMKDVTTQHQPRRSRLVLGIFLLALGALLLAVNLGYGLPLGWWQYLPMLLIALGLWGLILPNRHLDRSGGVWLLATGLYFLIGIFDWWGLGWSGAWPIFVIAAGLGFIVQRHDDDGGRHPRMPGNCES